jgi:integrase
MGLTFADASEEWFDRERFERDWSASTQVDYRSVLNAHLLPEFGPKRIEAITSEQIERWRDGLAEKDKRARHTVNKIVIQLHGILQHAVDRHDLIANPAAKVKRLRASCDLARFRRLR